MDSLVTANKHFTPSRLNSLYSDFSKLKDLNPEGYEANILAWESLLKDIIKNQQGSQICLSTHSPDLLNELALPVYGKPHLSIALQELVARKAMLPKSQIGKSALSKYIQWLLPFQAAYGGKLVDEEYIFEDVLANVAEHIIRAIDDETLFGRSTLQAKIPGLSKDDLSLALGYLSKKQKCIVDGDYVKFGKSPLTLEDKRVIELQELCQQLNTKIMEYKVEIAEITLEIKKSSSDSVSLKHLLRKRLILRKALDHVLGSNTELTGILCKISESKFNSQLYTQLAASSTLLKSLNAKIDIDAVHELKDVLREEMDHVDEISTALGASEVDEDELEEEFEKMFQEERAKNEVKNGSKNDSVGSLIKGIEDISITKSDKSTGEETADSKKEKLDKGTSGERQAVPA